MVPIDELLHKSRIIDRVNELFLATDQKQWQRVVACFAPAVVFEMGATPEYLSPAEIAARWEAGLAPIEAIHHQAGNHVVTLEGEKSARVFCYGIATHYRHTTSGNNVRTFVGSYDVHLVRDGDDWAIDAFRFNLKYVDGNLNLEKA